MAVRNIVLNFSYQFKRKHMRSLLEKRSNNNVLEATIQLLKSLKIPVTNTTAIEQVESHPDYPSLYSISDSLTKWKVENAAFHVDAEKLDELPVPFIAHTRKGGGNFVLVQNVNGTIDFINEKGKAENTSRENFLKNWTNTVLLAEKKEASGEKEYNKQKKKEIISALRIPFIAVSALLLVVLYTVLFGGAATGLASSLLLFTKLAGCIVTGLLLWFEVDKANPVLQQICSGGKNTNCTAVLSSKSSKLFSWLGWSEAGFFYFAGSFLSLLLTANFQLSTFSLLPWLNLVALPYTIFSIYYQWRIAKQWCPLCLAAQALLLIEFTISYFGFWAVPSNKLIISSANQLIILTSFLLPILFWVATKKAYLSAQAGKQYKKELNRLKYNKEIFTALLQKQKSITASTEGLGISIGNPYAKHTIVKVCNPYCGPCARAHKIIDELLEGNDVNVRIIFMVADDVDDKAKVVKTFIALHEQNNEKQITKALDDWYSSDKKDYAAFANKYVPSDKMTLQGNKLDTMKKWCDEVGISFTPTIFIDGYQLPLLYKIEDLKNLL